jgi:hypothetical protein
MTKNLELVMKEMCSRVGADFDKMNFKSTNWFQKYTWPQTEENLFVRWLVGTMMVNKEMRQEMMAFPSKRPKDLEKFAREFVCNYGWKIED